MQTPALKQLPQLQRSQQAGLFPDGYLKHFSPCITQASVLMLTGAAVVVQMPSSSLDADGFPTAESQLATAVGLQQEASDPNEGLAEAQVLLLEQQEDGLYDEDGTASVMSGATHQVHRSASVC